jgi:hypothetical protein
MFVTVALLSKVGVAGVRVEEEGESEEAGSRFI